MKKIILALLLLVGYTSCVKEKGCGYKSLEPCEEICTMFEDFENFQPGSAGNWQSILASTPNVVQNSGNNSLHIKDQSGGSWLYNVTDFPTNLLEQGCKLKYDVIYEAGGSGNSLTTNNSISIFQGASPSTATKLATFKLNTASLIAANSPFTTIVVPLELASGNLLPSNTFGEWRIGSGPPYTSAQINDFNNLIQNISGVGFFLDEGSNPSEEWYFDNFCFQNCCPN